MQVLFNACGGGGGGGGGGGVAGWATVVGQEGKSAANPVTAFLSHALKSAGLYLAY